MATTSSPFTLSLHSLPPSDTHISTRRKDFKYFIHVKCKQTKYRWINPVEFFFPTKLSVYMFKAAHKQGCVTQTRLIADYLLIPCDQTLTLGVVQHTCQVTSFLYNHCLLWQDVKPSVGYWTRCGVSIQTKPCTKLHVQKVHTHTNTQGHPECNQLCIPLCTRSHMKTRWRTHRRCQSWCVTPSGTMFFCEV